MIESPLSAQMRLPRKAPMFAEATYTYSLRPRRLEWVVRWPDHVIEKPAVALSFKHIHKRRIEPIYRKAPETELGFGKKAVSMLLSKPCLTVFFCVCVLKEDIFPFFGGKG